MGKGDIARPPKKRRDITMDHTPAMPTKSSVNLNDWIDSPILAKDVSGHYYPGIITGVPSVNTVDVMLDRHSQNEPRTFTNILEHTDLIVSNHSAPAIMLKVGVLVCIKSKNDDAYFSLGTVKRVEKGPPMQCLVQTHSDNQELWVSRAGVRLIQPPWYDDLEDTGGQEVSLYMVQTTYQMPGYG